MERWQVNTPRSFVPYVNLCQRVTEPYHDSKPAYWIMKELGKRFGFEGFDELPGEKELVRQAVENAEQPDGSYIDWDEIVEVGYWAVNEEPTFGERDRLYNSRFYFSISEKNEEELSSMQIGVRQTSEKTVPYYMPPKERTTEYPLRLFAGGKTLWHTQGATRNLPYLMQNFDENAILSDKNYVFLNPETAEEFGVNHEEEVRVESPVGSVEGICRTSETISKDFVQITHGFGHTSEELTVAYSQGMNPNKAVNDLRWDYISGCFTVNEEICTVRSL